MIFTGLVMPRESIVNKQYPPLAGSKPEVKKGQILFDSSLDESNKNLALFFHGVYTYLFKAKTFEPDAV